MDGIVRQIGSDAWQSRPIDPIVDPFGRLVSYLRVSVADRCDYRCTYCMSEHMTFLTKRDLLTLDELGRLCSTFIEKGVKKIRLTGGEPLARYVDVKETGGRMGFITPIADNFCEGCNRVRLTCTGTLYMCLGQDTATDLREVLRSDAQDGSLSRAIDGAIRKKPKGHDFIIDRNNRPAVARHMSVTGG